MKTFIYIGILCLFLNACKNKTDQLKEKLIPIIKEGIMTDDKSMAKIDSLTIYRIDTLNDLRYLTIKENNILDKVNAITSVLKRYNKQISSKISDLKASQSDVEIANNYNSQVLKNEAVNNYNNSKQNIETMISEGAKYNDTVNMYYEQIKQIQQKIKKGQIDKNNCRGYIVSFKILGADKENTEIRKDSLTAIISPNYRIIPYKTI